MLNQIEVNNLHGCKKANTEALGSASAEAVSATHKQTAQECCVTEL